VLASLALVVSLWLLLQAVTMLYTWSTSYGATGELTVGQCDEIRQGWSRLLRCEGELVVEPGAEPVPSRAVGGVAAFDPGGPDQGAVIEVYYRRGRTDRVFPQRGRSVELARVIIDAIPLTILVVGLAAWLLSWSLTRRYVPADGTFDEQVSQRFVFRSYARRWVLVGAAWLVVDRLLVSRLLGPVSLG
jgi:hypothetical protein